MPRKPNPQSKTDQLVIKSTDPIDQQKFKAVREIVSRNPELTIKKALMPGVDLFLRKHNWPPGNSQTLMPSFIQPKLTDKKCEYPRCDKPASYIDYPKPPGKPKVYSCQKHHDHYIKNRLLKSSRLLKK